MNLQEFIKETLVQIHGGLRDTNAACAGEKSEYPPFQMWKSSGFGAGDIEFDVAVTISDEGSADAGASAKVGIPHILVASASIGGKGAVSKESISRVRFRVQVNQELE